MTETGEGKLSLEQFKAFSRAIAESEDFNVLVSYLAGGICRTFGVKGASIMVLDENEDRLVRVSSCGISEAYLNKGPVFVDSRYCSLDTGRVERVEDLQSDDRVQYPEAARREGLTSLLAVPVKYRETPVGVIRLYHTGRMPVSEADIDSLCVVASLLGLVIENNELRGFLEPVKRAVESLPSRISKA